MNGWTKAEVTRLREVMLSQGRGIDEIADEVRVVCHVTRLASYRLAHGLSQPQAVARCHRYVEGGALDQPTLSRLEQFPARGSRTPLAVQLMALATAYGTQPLRLLTPDALELLDPREREVIVRLGGRVVARAASLSRPDEAGQLEQSSQLSQSSQLGQPSRPGQPVEVLGRAGDRSAAAAALSQLFTSSRRALQFSAMAEGSNTGPETLSEMEAGIRRLALWYPQQPIGPMITELTHLQDVGFRLLEGRQRPPQTATLYLLTGIVCGMLAKASHDLGDPGFAMTQARAGFICADNAGHDGLRTWVRGLQSLICYWAGWSQDALHYAQSGAEPARYGRGSATVWIAAQEARAWGMVGNESATIAALSRARRVMERVRDDDLDEIGGILTFAPARHLYYAADALALIPEQNRVAEELAGEAIAAYERGDASSRSFSDEAGARCDLAMARARQGDAEGAREALGPVLSLPVSQRINGVITSARRVDLAATGLVRGRSGRELRAVIEAFCLTPAREA